MPVWCTTSSGNVKVKAKRSISFLCLPSISLSFSRTHTTRALLRLLQLSWPQRAWGMGPGAWAGLECGGQGGRAARITSQSVGDGGGGGWWFSGVRLWVGPSQPMNDRHRLLGKAQSQAWPLSEFDREGPVEYWTLDCPAPVHGLLQGGLVCSCRSTPIGTTLVSALPVPSQLYY